VYFCKGSGLWPSERESNGKIRLEIQMVLEGANKKVIIEKFLRNIPTPDIARMTQHTEEACDRYIKSFKKVQLMYGKMKPVEIARTLDISERLVQEYIDLIEEQGVKNGEVNHVG